MPWNGILDVAGGLAWQPAPVIHWAKAIGSERSGLFRRPSRVASVENSPSPRCFLMRLFLGRLPRRTFFRIFLLVAASLVTFNLILLPVRVTGISMEPTCKDGWICFINLLAYQGREPQRGDIVGIRFASGGPILLKRVLGLPGERIAFHTGTVFINRVRLDEPYLVSPGTWEWSEDTLENDTYFVTGDNREVTEQFRVGRKQIIGRLWGR